MARETAILHLLANASPAVMERMLLQAASEDCVVLIADGVHVLADAACLARLRSMENLLCLAPDTAARGLSAVAAARSVALVDDDELVRRIAGHRHCLTWK